MPSEFRPIAIKLMVLGCDKADAKPCIVVLCPKAAAKKVKRFFRQDLAKCLCEVYPPHQIGFEVEIVGQSPRPIRGDALIEVWAEKQPDNAVPFSAPRLRVSHAGIDRIATLGGAICVYTQGEGRLFGMTVGHVLSWNSRTLILNSLHLILKTKIPVTQTIGCQKTKAQEKNWTITVRTVSLATITLPAAACHGRALVPSWTLPSRVVLAIVTGP
jgi:hypothetical protein